MLARLSLAGRLVLIVLSLLLALAALGLTLSITARERRATGAEHFPVPAQAAAIVELLDTTPAANRPRVLKAVSSEAFRVRIVDVSKVARIEGSRLPGVEWLVAQYLEAMLDREVMAVRVARENARPVLRALEHLAGDSRSQISLAVALRDGDYALFEVHGDASRRIFGVPIGLGIGLFGCLFAAIALWAIAREARPLRDLALSLARFAGDGAPREVRPSGAPEVRRLIAATNDMQSRISALIRGRTMLLGAISHDLKTYITRLRLRAETIENSDQRHRAERDLDDMTTLIDDALSLARGTIVSEREEPIDLAAIVAEEVAHRRDDAIEVGPIVQAVVQVRGDPIAIHRVIANLLDNARRYGERCRVSLRRNDDGAVVRVEDDGPGIPEGERETVFEPFYRLESSRNRSTGGSGLGLAIARQIAEAHGGTINLGKSAFGGLSAELFLPKHEPNGAITSAHSSPRRAP